MADPAANARALFPTIQITLVSIVVALALQQLLDRLPTVDALWEFTIVAAGIWCQALVAFVIIIKMWTGFVLTAVVTDRVPRALDLLGPIGVLIFVDAQIASIGVEHTLRWWYVMGAGSLVAAAFIAGQLPVASVDPQRNADAFDGLAAGFRRPAAIEVAAGILALGIAVLHQLFELSAVGLLVVGVLYLVGQLISAIGAIVGWRALRDADAMPRGALQSQIRGEMRN